MNRKGFGVIVVIFGIVIIVLALVFIIPSIYAYYHPSSFDIDHGGSSEMIPAPASTWSAVSTSTNGWNAYQNQQFNISFEYPSDWKINTALSTLHGPISLDNFNNAYANGGIIPAGGADIDITTTTIPTSLDQFAINEAVGTNLLAMGDISVANASCASTYDADSLYSNVLIYKEVSVYCPVGNTLYKIYLSYPTATSSDNIFPPEFTAFLGTIQFSSASNSPVSSENDSSSSWQTYIDPHNLFSMNLPPELQILEDSAQEGGYATYAFAVRMNEPGPIDTWSVAEIFVYTLSQWKTIQQLQTDGALPVLITQGKNFVYAIAYSEANVDSNFNEALKTFKALQ